MTSKESQNTIMPINLDRTQACDILGVNTNDSLEKVRKAYQVLSKRHHPDRNKTDPNANKTFDQIQKAYKFLTDLYQDIVFDDDNIDQPNQPFPNEVQLYLTLEEMFNGCVKHETVERKILSQINGNIDTEEVTLEVFIAPGIMPTTRITLEQQGDRHIGNIPADVIFVVNELSHKYFRRIRYDLEYVAKITFEESCFLSELSVPTLDRSKGSLSWKIVDETITNETKIIIPCAGFPIPNEAGQVGDLIVRFDIYFPQDLPVQHFIDMTLEQILYGYAKRVMIKRPIVGTNKFEEQILEVEVKPGTEDGQSYILSKCGIKKAGRTPADIIMIVRTKPHAYFKRKQVNIIHTINVTINEAKSGNVTFEVPTLDNNETLSLQIFESITAKTIKKFPGYGLPHFATPKLYGDLVVRFNILKDISVPKPVEYNFGLTLENVFHGIQKQIKIVRIVIDSDWNKFKIEKILTLDIKPGTKSGDKFRFPRIGNQSPDMPIPADIIFTATDKPHEIFERTNFVDLQYISKLSKQKIRLGGQIEIPTLEGHKLSISMDDIIDPSTGTITFTGCGLPHYENPNRKGDLLVRFTLL